MEKNSTSSKFNKKSHKALKEAIDRLPGLNESLKSIKIDLINIDEIHVFGYGSLPDKPHYPPTSKTEAYLWGYSRDLCCKSIRSGTPKYPGLTLGLDKNEDGIVPGSILSYKDLSPDNLIQMLNKFADREVVTDMHIYNFEMLEIEKSDGSKVMAITCVADTSAAGYVGDTLSPMEEITLPKKKQEAYTLYRKGQIIAQANGNLKNGDHATGKSYFDRFVRIPTEENLVQIYSDEFEQLSKLDQKRQTALFHEQQKLLKLASSIDEHREKMKKDVPHIVTMLEKREAEQLKIWHLARQKGDVFIPKSPDNKPTK